MFIYRCIKVDFAYKYFSWFQTKGRVHEDEAIEKMLNDLSLIKKFE